MSTLSKVFVILLFLMSVAFTGIAVTLFSMRIDWKGKFYTEMMRHDQDVIRYIDEVSKQEALVENIKIDVRVLRDVIQSLEKQNQDLEQRYQVARQDHTALLAEVNVVQQKLTEYVEQLRVQAQHNRELLTQIEEYKAQVSIQQQERDTAVAELQYTKQQNELLLKNIGQLEENYVNVNRELEDRNLLLHNLQLRGIDVYDLTGTVVKPIDGRVQAVSEVVNLVILSVGRDQGVAEGNPFTVFRGDKFIAKVIVEKVEKDWCSARVEEPYKVTEIKPGDSASTRIYR